jgi:hypothetical protein
MSTVEVATAVLLATCLAAGSGICADQSEADSAAARDLSPPTLAKIVPGVTTETEVQALLGKPSYDIEFGSGALCPPKPSAKSLNEPTVNSWNYRGRDAKGPFVVHIEFDQNYVTYLIAKIPINGVGVARMVKPQPDKT